ncbi:MAG: trypsin-like peptidase domain-containing protein [Burkholderiales bacterium]|jgi:S1-C subfamily serine protease|nr:trypsin-like peptidase domain-containing protein [Burkholderiales bacterium]
MVLADPLLLACTQVSTWLGARLLTTASGFFFTRDARLFVVTSRHVLFDAPTQHMPDAIGLTLHTDAADLTRVASIAVPLYENGRARWRQGEDSGGAIDVAAIEVDRALLPAGVQIETFGPAHLQARLEEVALGTPLLVVGFPLGFHDTRHYLPVARHGAVASAFGVRFQGQGCFLTDARTHRGMSGAPVVMRATASPEPLNAMLLGVHSSRMDMSSRDLAQDDTLGLNLAWYADILVTLTE